MKIYILNTGGTLGMVGHPLRPAKSAEELLDGVNIIPGIELILEDYVDRKDSTNFTHAERVEMARYIERNYDEHDAFIVLHGTDSLAETTALFSMAFKRSLQKPLFVIGAQMTKEEPGNEVHMQIENTLRIARSFVSNGVVGVFNVCIGDVWDGARVMKRAESDFEAFYTPGKYPVAKAYPHINLHSGFRTKDPVVALQGLAVDGQFEKEVATIKVSADTPPWVLLDLVENKRLRGVILECKGAGQIPDVLWEDVLKEKTYSWIDAIHLATEQGVHVGILSPFDDGRVILDRYELGQKAKDAGALGLETLTKDMADVKFRHAISLFPSDPQKIQEFIATNIVGELLPVIEDLS